MKITEYGHWMEIWSKHRMHSRPGLINYWYRLEGCAKNRIPIEVVRQNYRSGPEGFRLIFKKNGIELDIRELM